MLPMKFVFKANTIKAYKTKFAKIWEIIIIKCTGCLPFGLLSCLTQ